MKNIFLTLCILTLTVSCTKKDQKQTIWIYTSLYKDTIADIQPQLEKQFPDVKIQFYQAGSEEVAAKVSAESLAGKVQADILISSDRFWYEELATQNKLTPYSPQGSDTVNVSFKHPDNYYTTVSYPIMVIAYNNEVITEKEAPQSFKELTNSKWKDKVSSGSPLASGTNFTSVAFLVKRYGWDYFSQLRNNNLISEGGNSGVIRRLQSKERPVGIVLLENVLRLTETDKRIRFVIPKDGAIFQSNVLALVKKDTDQTTVKKVADWFFSDDGQNAMAKSFMYPASKTNILVTGAPEWSTLQAASKDMLNLWNRDFINETMKSREQIKDQFAKIVF